MVDSLIPGPFLCPLKHCGNGWDLYNERGVFPDRVMRHGCQWAVLPRNLHPRVDSSPRGKGASPGGNLASGSILGYLPRGSVGVSLWPFYGLSATLGLPHIYELLLHFFSCSCRFSITAGN